ncbi:MAG TPA: YggT family protein [Gaiellaceae bacterium]
MVYAASDQVRTFLLIAINIYALLIIIWVITSWVRLPYSLRQVQQFLNDVCEPYIRIWRRILPSMGGLDLSPMVALVALLVLEGIVGRVL